ncbi:MAG: methionyl-tRNA formyltransferase, partial [Candidatus Omnitrophica bacterium]|nr:methionyl-tRNA formyltransferase [Candidatus Omnitrophota bacterium]
KTAGVEVLAPEDIASKDFSATLKEANPDLIIVATFDKKIPVSIINLPRLGAFNIHSSFLPQYRGPCPEFWVIRNGEQEAGVSIHYLSDEFDTGAIIVQKKVSIAYSDTVGVLLYNLAMTAAQLLMQVLVKFNKGEKVEGVPQDESLASYAPLVQPSDLQIDWYQSAETLYNLIRAANPVGGAWTLFRGYQMKVWHALQIDAVRAQNVKDTTMKPGTVYVLAEQKQLIVRTGDSFLELKVVQPALYYTVDAWSFKEKSLVKNGELLG